MRIRHAGLLAAALVALAITACGRISPLAQLPWARAQSIRVGVEGWWNSAVLPDAALAHALGSALDGAPLLACGSRSPSGAYTLTLLLPGGGTAGPLVWQGARLWSRGCAYDVPDTARWLLAGAVATAHRAWSGALLPWPQVSPAFPVGARATLTDWATGRSLQVIRWGGVRHADVEPATAADAGALRAINNGTWSWNRRPVLVTLPNGIRVAASMNGMPHGGGAVSGNAFSGHFCLHFLGSEVHRSGRIDERHLMAILTAGGVFGDGPQAATAALSAEADAPASTAAACD